MGYVINVYAASNLDELVSSEACSSFESAAKGAYEILVERIREKLTYYYSFYTNDDLALEIERFEDQFVKTEMTLINNRPSLTFFSKDLDVLIEAYAPD